MRVSGDANTCLNSLFLDFEHPAGKARGIHIPSTATVNGFRADVRMWGFEDTGDVFLDIDSDTCTGLDITVHGNSAENITFPANLDDTNVKQYVSLPAGGLDSTNQIRFVNDATGQVLELDETQTYD
jgi:hypothetical protein